MNAHPRDVAEYLRRIAQDLDDFYQAGLCERVAQIVLDDWALKVAARSLKESTDD